MTILSESFTLIEVLVVIAMPAVIFYPGCTQAKVVLKTASDLSNLRQ